MTIAKETIRSLRAVTPQSTIIEARHISQRFTADNGTELTVLHDISFNLYEGEIVAILGRSGAGKSTFLRALAGLVKPTSGTVKYRGETLTGPNPGIALVFQTFALMPWLTVQDNVELGLKARGVPKAKRTKLALDAIDMIGLDGFESAYPKELSGGMRQRVGIARALVLQPDALFMDEPFSALDVLTAENLRQEVLKLWSSEQRSIKSVLMVTHNIEEAVEMADRVVVLGSHPGHLIANVRVDLPRPRDRHSAAFEAMMDKLYAILTRQATQPAQPAHKAEAPELSASSANVPAMDETNLQTAEPLEKIKGRPLPNATPGGLAGLLDVVAEHPDGIDLADLASDLSFEVDDLFPLVDAGTLLHVCNRRARRPCTNHRGWRRLASGGYSARQAGVRLAGDGACAAGTQYRTCVAARLGRSSAWRTHAGSAARAVFRRGRTPAVRHRRGVGPLRRIVRLRCRRRPADAG